MDWFLLIAGGVLLGAVVAVAYVVIRQLKQQIKVWQQKIVDLYCTIFTLERQLQTVVPALQDNLTALIPWPTFQDRLGQNLKLSARHHLTLGVLYIDLDNFKIINDALSFEVGDLLLKEVASRLQACIRQVDSICRPNQDTFVVQLSRLNKPETAAIVAQRMLHALSRPYLLGEHALNASASIGIALYPDDALDVVSLLRHAEQALRTAKSKGRHTYQFYQAHMHSQSQRELAIYNQLATDDVFNTLDLHYQPIMKMTDNSLEAMEVQLVWNHPALGSVAQDELLRHADQQRRMNVIVEWVLQKACRQYLNWIALGLTPRLLAVPVHLKQFENSHFIYRLSQLIQQLHFNPSHLLLMVQDTGAEVAPAALEKAFNMLTYLGVKLALDQQSSNRLPLRYLAQYTFQYLRVEKVWVDDAETNNVMKSLIESMLSLTQRLALQLIVPGVDTEAQKTILLAMGVECMQGAALGGPQSERALAEQLTAN